MVGGYYYEIMVVVGLIKTVKMTMMIIQQAIVRRGGGYRSPIARHPILTLDRVPPGRYIITSIIASSPFDVHPISGYINILQHKTGPADISMLGGLHTPLMTNTSNTAPNYCPEI